MTSPVPGFTAPAPRTWADGDIISVPRLRADCTNLGYLMAGGVRPLLSGQGAGGLITGTGTLTLSIPVYQCAVNTWNVPVTVAAPGSGVATPVPYQIPMAGWYLAQGAVTVTGGTDPGALGCSTGFTTVVNGGTASTDGGAVPAANAPPASWTVGAAACELYQFNTYAATGDSAFLYVGLISPSFVTIENYFTTLEWVGLPTSGLTGYTGPYGTVVATPAAASAWPPGPGTYLTASGGVPAGGTTAAVADATGIVTGGVLGLDWHMGQPQQPVAEVVTVTSVAGGTIGITAAAYAHAQDAPVAVPVSHPFLNEQVRDPVRFLAYPPLLRAEQDGSPQSLSSQALPAGTAITLTETCDTFSGFSGSEYTVPVAGCYLTYGQVYYAGSTATFTASAGVQVSGGTILWGTTFRSASPGGVPLCATFRRTLRFAEGDTVTLYGSQNSGADMDTQVGGGTGSTDKRSKLIMVWRST